MAIPATGAAIGTPASMSASDAPQTVAIDDEPFDSRMSLMTRTVYGNESESCITCSIGALGKRSVADLTATGTAQGLHLAHGVGREGVVQHELVEAVAQQVVDPLLVLACAQGHRDEGLRLAARKERRAVRARKDSDLAGDGPHVGQTSSVDALLGIDNHRPNEVVLEIRDRRADLTLALGETRISGDEGVNHRLLGRIERGIAGQLLAKTVSRLDLRQGQWFDLGGETLVLSLGSKARLALPPVSRAVPWRR